MIREDIVQLVESIAQSGGTIHGFPASKMFMILKEGISRNARLRAEQDQFPGQGGKDRYCPSPVSRTN